MSETITKPTIDALCKAFGIDPEEVFLCDETTETTWWVPAEPGPIACNSFDEALAFAVELNIQRPIRDLERRVDALESPS